MNAKVNPSMVRKEFDFSPDARVKFDDFSGLCHFVTGYMVDKYDLDDTAEINCGYCFVWAYLVWSLWKKDDVTFLTTEAHVVVHHDGLYYDSEHENGHPDHRELLGPVRMYHRKLVDVKTMCWYWARAGGCKDELRRLVRKFDSTAYVYVRDDAKKGWTKEDYFYGHIEFKKLKTA